MKNKRFELKQLQVKISKAYDKHLNQLYKKERKLKDEIENQDSKELLGKTFIYKNNSFSCPKNKKDYWNVYLKVIGLIKDGIRVITVEKNSHDCIEIQTEDRWNNNLIGYEPCDEKEFDKHYTKLSKEIEKLKNE